LIEKVEILILPNLNQKGAFFELNFIFRAQKAKSDFPEVIFVTCVMRGISVILSNTVFQKQFLKGSVTWKRNRMRIL